MNIAVVLPVKDDYESCLRLIREMSEERSASDYFFRFVVVDDFSKEIPIHLLKVLDVNLIINERTLGHQRSIIRGLNSAIQDQSLEAIVVMDADGEDRPEDAMELLEVLKSGSAECVLAVRGKRESGILFLILYRIFQFSFKILVGRWFGFGNFMAMRSDFAIKLLKRSTTNLSVAATVIKDFEKIGFLKIDRGKRYDGVSKMTISRLVEHAISIISVNADKVSLRLVAISLISTVFMTLVLFVVLTLRFLGIFALAPGIATQLTLQVFSGSLFFMGLTLLSLISMFNFRYLQGKNESSE